MLAPRTSRSLVIEPPMWGRPGPMHRLQNWQPTR
jgi:hypothetical protein